MSNNKVPEYLSNNNGKKRNEQRTSKPQLSRVTTGAASHSSGPSFKSYIMSGHASPVAMRRRVSSAVGKDAKFACSSIDPPSTHPTLAKS